MTEVLLPEPVRAVNLAKDAFHGENVPGSFFVQEQGEGVFFFWYRCPCGCGAVAPLNVGREHKPEDSPSWHWNGSLATPTLKPSVWHRGHWHGWLTDGVWHQ